MTYPKRLIEVDLPIKRISAHARREKSIRHGHISTLHIWWARRPLAACRAVLCASLWPDPADPLCPQAFRDVAAVAVHLHACNVQTVKAVMEITGERHKVWAELTKRAHRLDPADAAHQQTIRNLLLDFIADFAAWESSTEKHYLEVARVLTQAAHLALQDPKWQPPNAKELKAAMASGEAEKLEAAIRNLQSAMKDSPRPLVVDPFAGGGAIPLEALRVGADAFASDLNPVAVLLNKVVLEYIPKYGQKLADEVRKWGEWIKKEAEKELAEFYPKDPDGATPIAYLWARTIQCEGPGCGAEVPLMNQRLISKRRTVGVEFICKARDILTNIRTDLPASEFGVGTVTNAKVTCPRCGFTMSAERYRQRSRNGQLGERHFCTVLSLSNGTRKYRNPSEQDRSALHSCKLRLAAISRAAPDTTALSVIPNELLSSTEPRRLNVLYYGFNTWGALFNSRQQLAWTTFSNLLHRAFREFAKVEGNKDIAAAVSTSLGLVLSNMLQYNCNMSTWLSDGMISVFIQSSSIPMRADYAEANPLMELLVGGLSYQLERTEEALRRLSSVFDSVGSTVHASATDQVLPDDSVAALVTDPPYYFAIPYAELSDFFYVWLKRFLRPVHPDLLRDDVTPKKKEAIQNLPHSQAVGQKTRQHFEDRIFEALEVGRREVGPSGIAVVVFAHASTEGWESLLNALLRAGWIITASWPIDTEKEGRMLASRQRALTSSVHLVCRPREHPDGSVRTDAIGDWRDVLQELPKRIHEWMPRLAAEGVVGADAIFACIGPALEIFSRYSRVEKASGEQVTLKEYLEHVWAAVSKEALTMIFAGADTAGFEEDSRLTAMWLWTLAGGVADKASAAEDAAEDAAGDDEEEGGGKPAAGGFVLEYDAARKIAQGLGAHLEQLSTLIEVKGDKARLLPVGERTRFLFGKDGTDGGAGSGRKKAKKPAQKSLFEEINEAEAESGGWESKQKGPVLGKTVLDRVHQSMLLFGSTRSEALKRFITEDGVGKDARFWRLAQALSALYPPSSEEKRWVDGVLARKKGLGF